jgi:hypothetical protein
MHELPQLHNSTAGLRTWSHYNPLKCCKLTPNIMAPISKRNDTCSNNTVRTSNLRSHWKDYDSRSNKYSQASSCVEWLSGEQTRISRTISVIVIKEFSWTHQFMRRKFLQLIPHQLYEEKHKATWHSMIHFFVPASREESDHNVPDFLLYYKYCFIARWWRKIHPFTTSSIIYTPSYSHIAILLKCWHW